jgi:hypothetical protein
MLMSKEIDAGSFSAFLVFPEPNTISGIPRTEAKLVKGMTDCHQKTWKRTD